MVELTLFCSSLYIVIIRISCIFVVMIIHQCLQRGEGSLFTLFIRYLTPDEMPEFDILQHLISVCQFFVLQGGKLKYLHHCLDILPHVTCRSPQESLDILSDKRRPPDYTDQDRLFDAQEFKSPTFQRPFQYLKRLDTNCKLNDVNAHIPEGDKKQCLTTLLKYVTMSGQII